MNLGLAEWVVLAVVDEQPVHGFAVAALTSADGELGRVWTIPRPIVYRALGRLGQAGLVSASGTESGPGPQRTPYAATPSGHQEALRWLEMPVEHVRELRSQFLLKLALHQRRGSSPDLLVDRQRTALRPIVEAVAAQRARSQGFDQVLLAWRASTASAAVAFLDELPLGTSSAREP